MKRQRIAIAKGDRFGSWRVVGDAPVYRVNGRKMWLCRCICGTKCDVRASSLTDGRSHGCGCNSKTFGQAAAVRRFERDRIATTL